MSLLDTSSFSNLKDAIHIRNALTEVARWRYGDLGSLTQKEFAIPQGPSSLRRSGIIHRHRTTIIPSKATGIPDHAIALPQHLDIGTMVEVQGLPSAKRYGIVVNHTRFNQGKAYVRSLNISEIGTIEKSQHHLRTVQIHSSQIRAITHAEGVLANILSQIDQIRTLFIQAILRFFLLDDSQLQSTDNLFLRIYMRILAVSAIFFVLTFIYVVFIGGGLATVFLYW